MTTYKVSSSAQLAAAAKAAHGGDTVLLATGTYASLDIRGTTSHYASNVTFASADPNRPAVITNFSIRQAANITLTGLVFDYHSGSSKAGAQPFLVSDVSNITLTRVSFNGDRVGGYAFGTGLVVSNSKNVTLQSSDLSDFKRGAQFIGVDHLKVVGNNVHLMSGDGMTFAQVTNSAIQGNHVYDMRGNPNSAYHKDMIQFWTTGTTRPTSNVVVSGNVLASHDGSTQSIFMGNELGAAGNKAMYWQHVTIENNTIVAGHHHGISVYQGNGVAIRNNTVVHDTASGFNRPINIPQINVTDDSMGITITGNVAHAVPAKEAPSWVVSNNKIVPNGFKVPVSAPPKAGAAGAPAVNAASGPDKAAAPDAAPATAPDKVAPPHLGALSDLLTPQSRAFYAAFAQNAGLTLKDGVGDAGDDLVLARGAGAQAGGGNNILVGNAAQNWLYSGPGNNTLAGLGGHDDFLFFGSNLGHSKTDTVLDLHFAEGDQLAFHHYAAGTFAAQAGGNPLDVREGGSAVIVNSMADLQELDQASRAVTLHGAGHDLVLDIAQGGKVHELHLLDLV